MSDIQVPMIHPGEILREEFLVPLELSAGALAKLIGVPRTRIERIAKEAMGISPDTAFRLGKVFSTTPEFWMNMQRTYDLQITANDVDVSNIEPLVRQYA